MKLFIELFVIFSGTIVLLSSLIAVIGLRQPTTLPLWGLKVMSSGLSQFLFLAGIAVVVIGWLLQSKWAIGIGMIGALLYLFHIIQVTRPIAAAYGFDQAFGKEWEKRMSASVTKSFLRNRYAVVLPERPAPVFNQNIPFYTIPGTDRTLVCDIWQPPQNISSSGLAFIYLHGSAWAVLDKDFGTRNFFSHLANQGHVIMDVAYRLFPETDMMGMVHDAQHAIAWMKHNAALYNIDPEKIAIGGGSAGAHIALLAAYASDHDDFMPSDLANKDLQVAGVISLYGQADLKATFYHTAQHLSKTSALSAKKPGDKGGMPSWLEKSMEKNWHRLGFDKDVQPGILTPMLGGSPEEKPDAYAFYSPMKYIDGSLPPTLIIHGKHDILAPVKAIQEMYHALTKKKVPVVMHLIPQTDHAFDLIFPKYSPSAQNAIYDVERFLAIIAGLKLENTEAENSGKKEEWEVLQYS